MSEQCFVNSRDINEPAAGLSAKFPLDFPRVDVLIEVVKVDLDGINLFTLFFRRLANTKGEIRVGCSHQVQIKRISFDSLLEVSVMHLLRKEGLANVADCLTFLKNPFLTPVVNFTVNDLKVTNSFLRTTIGLDCTSGIQMRELQIRISIKICLYKPTRWWD